LTYELRQIGCGDGILGDVRGHDLGRERQQLFSVRGVGHFILSFGISATDIVFPGRQSNNLGISRLGDFVAQ
jgi:hypothetical protein